MLTQLLAAPATAVTVPLDPRLFVAVLLGAVRAAAWLVTSPPFQSRAVPGQIKALLSLGIALPLAPRVAAQLPELTVPAMLLAAGEQVVVGAALGFVTALIFAAVQAAGDLIDLFGGFSLAFAFDPLSSSSTSVFGRFYMLLATTLLFTSDGYLVVLRGFARSYDGVPVGVTSGQFAEVVATGVTSLFLAAVQIAGPLIAVLFCADLGLGLLNRVAPALHAFALGFPVKIFLTLTLTGVVVLLLPGAVHRLLEQAAILLRQLSGG